MFEDWLALYEYYVWGNRIVICFCRGWYKICCWAGCAGGACIGDHCAGSNCIRNTSARAGNACTKCAFVEGIYVLSTDIWDVGAEGIDARVAKGVNIGGFLIESVYVREICSTCIKVSCIQITCARNICVRNTCIKDADIVKHLGIHLQSS